MPGRVIVFAFHVLSMRISSRRVSTRRLTDRHKAFFRYSLNDNRLSEPGSTPALGNANSETRAGRITPRSINQQFETDPAERVPVQYAVRRDPSFALSAGTDFNKDAGIKGMEKLADRSTSAPFRISRGPGTRV